MDDIFLNNEARRLGDGSFDGFFISFRMLSIIMIDNIDITFIFINRAQRPTMRPHEFWGIPSYLSKAIATFGGRYVRELF